MKEKWANAQYVKVLVLGFERYSWMLLRDLTCPHGADNSGFSCRDVSASINAFKAGLEWFVAGYYATR